MAKSDNPLALCQKALGYRFKNPDLLGQALMHASAANDRLASNERLEFLGDAILSTVVCSELYRRFPEYLEGELTKIKSMIVSGRTCGRIADAVGLERFLHIGKGMQAQSRIPRSCGAAGLEAVIGAVYLDGGERQARKFILRHFGQLLDEADANRHQENFKSILQHYAQREPESTPTYEVLDEKGPDHSKCFEVAVVISDRRFESAWGPSKKEAEQLAAYNALLGLDALPED